ncbi:hypothetical protein Vretimale_9331 [Volvox reticuliferus]|uniref:Uncharacterized protein n=1 Tax=Volvox reticuliferus TaxID=1737510 RepID=A0A8J4CG14_9CHLO|nr:hypothetical protein Vretifemale_10101 [Volvox reticuliferus]GIM04838.1 hypothetical protein Vretimale_9331 [Volvox reticuliferus]
MQIRVAMPGLAAGASVAKPVTCYPLLKAISHSSTWHARGNALVCCSGATSPSASGEDSGGQITPTPGTSKSPGLLGRIKHFFIGDKLTKDKLAQLGMGAFASYGFISNTTYGICLVIAWISFVKATGKSPLAAGQWPAFLGFYAGLWTMQNFVRPLRFSLAIALAPIFEKLIQWISQKTGLSTRWAFGLYLTCFALLTAALIFGTLYVLGGFPN